jgi:FkbM family methyltransferase
VIALEPHAGLHAMLSANVDRNGLTHVACLRIAAAAGSGTARFVDSPERESNSGLARVARDGEAADFECESVSLDSLAERNALDPVDVVKIDVEGAEVDVLRGMAAGLARGRYRAILLECHPAALAGRGVSLGDCLEPLASAGYRGWHIDHSAGMHRRAASADVAASDLLSPVTSAPADSAWPHYLWIAPGQPAPV